MVLNSKLGTIEVGNNKVDSSEGFKKSNFFLNEQISSLTLESLVRHFFNNNDDITGLGARVFISFSVEYVVIAIRRTLIDFSFNNFLLFADLLSIANFTFILLIDDFSLSTAFITRSLRLRVHARTELDHLGDHTTSLASSTLLDSAFFTSKTIATSADSLTVNSNLGLLSIVNFFKSDLEGVLDRLSFLRSTSFRLASATTSTHHIEDISHTSATHAAFTSSSLESTFIIQVTLLRIRENLVSLLNFLELFFIATTIGMMISSSSMVSFLNLSCRSILINSKGFVEFFVINRTSLLSSHTRHSAHTFEGVTTAKEHFSS